MNLIKVCSVEIAETVTELSKTGVDSQGNPIKKRYQVKKKTSLWREESENGMVFYTGSHVDDLERITARKAETVVALYLKNKGHKNINPHGVIKFLTQHCEELTFNS